MPASALSVHEEDSRCSYGPLRRAPLTEVVPALPPLPAAWGADVTPVLWRPLPLSLPRESSRQRSLNPPSPRTDVETEAQTWEAVCSPDVEGRDLERGLLTPHPGCFAGWGDGVDKGQEPGVNVEHVPGAAGPQGLESGRPGFKSHFATCCDFISGCSRASVSSSKKRR